MTSLLKKSMQWILLSIIGFYRYVLSPLKVFLGCQNCCRYSPSCSEYAQNSCIKHGALKGSYLTIKRLLRCNRFFKGGFDPVP